MVIISNKTNRVLQGLQGYTGKLRILTDELYKRYCSFQFNPGCKE